MSVIDLAEVADVEVGSEQMPRPRADLPLETRRVRLRPLTPDDYGMLYELTTDPRVGLRLGYRGATPSPEEFVDSLWRHVMAQFIIESTQSMRALGLVVASSPDLRNRFAYLSVMADPRTHGTGLAMHGAALFVNYVFSVFDLRKLYAESLDPSFRRFKSGLGRYFHQEGCLRGHEYLDGEYVDMHLLAMYREDWRVIRESVLPRLVGPRRHAARDGKAPEAAAPAIPDL